MSWKRRTPEQWRRLVELLEGSGFIERQLRWPLLVTILVRQCDRTK